MDKAHSNRLIHETSPYLLQHAHNPVNWYPWGDEALQKAKEENRVILVSIGYAACHWCHVMERESFEDPATAAIMNQHFINIKIDREERPDLDHIYMDAVQAMTGSGGWPLNVFLTPDTKPFYGGTYFPPVRAFNRSSWKEVLHGVAQAWRERRTEIESQAENLTAHLASSGDFGRAAGVGADPEFTAAHCHTIFENLLRTADTAWGGFGQAPKFPQTFSISWLLQYHHFSGNIAALEHALLSLDKMLQGGIYDQAGGGFARYSTDAEWLAPHFEKMLYDNALLILVLCDAYALTKYPRYKKAVEQTITFVQREMMHPAGGFYAALDADSEGKEGRFYIWQKAEVVEVLGSDAPLFCEYFDVTDTGNWEGENILRILTPAALFCEQRGLDEAAFEAAMDSCLEKLLQKRAGRIRPQTDDKILLGWNALFISALCRAAGVFGNKAYAALAEDGFAFLWRHLRVAQGGVAMYHTYKEGVARFPAFLDDYAYLIQACIHLHEITSDRGYLVTASQLADYTAAHFGEEKTGFFFYTSSGQQDVIVRKKEVYDGAVPSGNSIMALNLACLGTVFDNLEWRRRSAQITGSLLPAVLKHPNSFAVWAAAVLAGAVGVNEVTVAGPAYRQFRDELLQHYLPAMVLQSGPADGAEPLLPGEKPAAGQTLIYLCRNFSCLPPLEQVQLLAEKAKAVQNLKSSAQ